MDTVLERPSVDPNRSPEHMLGELEDLNDAVLRRLETVVPAIRQRYEAELLPVLENARTLVAQRNSRARNVIEDAVTLFRTLIASSTQFDPRAASTRV